MIKMKTKSSMFNGQWSMFNGQCSIVNGLLCCFVLLFLLGCKRSAEGQDVADVPLVILDGDFGSSTDDLFALQMLIRYEEQGRCQLLGVIVDREGEENAAVVDVMATYFGHPDLPIALERDGVKNPKVWIDYTGLPHFTDENGEILFSRTLSDYNALPDGWQFYRQMLVAQPDHSVSIISVGFVSCLAKLLESPGDDISPLSGVELVRRKVKCLYIQGGVFGKANEACYNFGQGIPFAKTLIRLWPSDVDVIYSPGEVGQCIEYLPELVISDISWTDCHPIKQVYLCYDCNTGQKMWDALTVINAIEGDNNFTHSERGTVSINDSAVTTFTPLPTGNSRYQIPGDSIWADSILQKIRNINKIR